MGIHSHIRMYEDYSQNFMILLQAVRYHALGLCSWKPLSMVAGTGQAEAYQKRGGLGKRCWEPTMETESMKQSSFGQQSDKFLRSPSPCNL